MYKHCLVAFDHTPLDRHIAGHISCWQQHIGIAVSHVAYVASNADRSQAGGGRRLSGASGSTGPEMFPNRSARSIFGRDTVDLQLQGHPVKALSSCIRKHQIDLVGLGLKHDSGHFEQVGRRLLSESTTATDFLFIPPANSTGLNNILVPSDLSVGSGRVVERARKLFPDAIIEVYFVNYVPSGAVMEASRRKKMIRESGGDIDQQIKEFINSLGISKKRIRHTHGMSSQFNAGQVICRKAAESRSDLIVVGRMNRLDKELPFLGSVTEKILSLSLETPVLVLNH